MKSFGAVCCNRPCRIHLLQDHDDDLQDDDDGLLPGPRVTWAHFQLLSHVEPAQATIIDRNCLRLPGARTKGNVFDIPFLCIIRE